ncbi:MAG: acetolactate synthase large subunit [Solirubrobacteraceae bacterium]|nr:acetolactate synthase large subunit [Solirubrobacteraceae bacterium]
MSTTGAQVLVSSLEAAGVEVVFGLPGVHNLAAWEALRESPIRLVGVRHEQAAAYAADGYARTTGRVGVALVTTGPGAANTLGAVGEAWAGGSPIVVIATDIPTTLRRPGVHRGVLHECVDQAAMFAPVTKAQLAGPDATAAIATALAHPRRPVYLEIPTDVLSEPAQAAGAVPPAAMPQPDPGAVQRARALLAGARRPLVWAGGGAARDGAGAAVAALAEGLGAPVLTTYQAAGLVDGHPLALGLPPHLPEIGALWDRADVVVAVGSDLDGVTTQNWEQPQPPALVAVNVDAADASKNYRVDAVVQATATAGAAALADGTAAREPWVDVAAVRSGARARLEREHPAELAFLDAFARAAPDEAVVVCDMCIAGYWLGSFHPVAAPGRLVYPLGWGTLGCAFPQAIGAALGGDGPVVSVSGDGGFLYACGELATVAQERIPLTAVIVDDGGYGMLRYDQREKGAGIYGVDLLTPDFVAMAQAFGVRAERVEGLADDFERALARHLADPEPSVLVAGAALDPPPTTSPRWYRASPPAGS